MTITDPSVSITEQELATSQQPSPPTHEALRAFALAEADALEAKVNDLWIAYQAVEQEARPVLERVEAARHEWYVATQRVEHLRTLFGGVR